MAESKSLLKKIIATVVLYKSGKLRDMTFRIIFLITFLSWLEFIKYSLYMLKISDNLVTI